MNKIFVLMSFLILSHSSAFAADAARGASLFKTCVECHGADAMGLKEKKAPALRGQFDWYIVSQLIAFKKKTRSNPEMYPFIKNLSEKDFADLAAHISTME